MSPYVPRVSKHGKKQFVKMTGKSGKNNGISAKMSLTLQIYDKKEAKRRQSPPPLLKWDRSPYGKTLLIDPNEEPYGKTRKKTAPKEL